MVVELPNLIDNQKFIEKVKVNMSHASKKYIITMISSATFSELLYLPLSRDRATFTERFGFGKLYYCAVQA